MSGPGMFGAATDLYKNRFEPAFRQLDYEADDYVIYPDVMRRRWMWHQPYGGGTAYSGPDYNAGTISGAPASTANRFQFQLPANTFTDPTSYRLYLKINVGASDTGTTPTAVAALCNYAHSVINQVTVRFTGVTSALVDQMLDYNVFSNMLYKFYATNYVQKFHASMEGYNTTASSRQWAGKSFMLPINCGFFTSLKKYIPNAVLPIILIEFLMEQNSRAVMYSTAPTGTGSKMFWVTQPQLIVSEIEVLPEYLDELRAKISEGQSMGKPIRLDYTSWTAFKVSIASGISGDVRSLLTGNFVGIRKIMFGQLSQSPPSAGTTDYLNTFLIDNLNNYRIQIGGRYFPDQPVYVNQSGSTSTNANASDSAMAAFFTMFSVGNQNNPFIDYIQSYPNTSTQGGDTSDWVFLLSTDFDDAGLPYIKDQVNSGPLSLITNYNPAVNSGTSTTGGLTIYVYLNNHRAVHIWEGNRVDIVEG